MQGSIPAEVQSPASRAAIRIHPFKRAAAIVARLLPRTWRFPICGTPYCAGFEDKKTEPTGLRIIPHGTTCHIGAHLDADNALIPESSPDSTAEMERRFLQRQRFFPRVQTISGTVGSIVSGSQSNYYHWMFESLPRLRFLRESQIPADRFYACYRQPFHQESLKQLGIDSGRVIDSSRVPYLRAERLLLPRAVSADEPWIIPWLRENLLPLAQPLTGASLPRRIYISRRKATSRGVVNEEELIEALAARGFQEVFLEQLAFGEQIALFQNAEAIVGPHGAAFTNLIFCAPDTCVVELMADGYGSQLYPQISHSQHLRHDQILCVPQDRARINASAIQVDVSRVEAVLDR